MSISIRENWPSSKDFSFRNKSDKKPNVAEYFWSDFSWSIWLRTARASFNGRTLVPKLSSTTWPDFFSFSFFLPEMKSSQLLRKLYNYNQWTLLLQTQKQNKRRNTCACLFVLSFCFIRTFRYNFKQFEIQFTKNYLFWRCNIIYTDLHTITLH